MENREEKKRDRPLEIIGLLLCIYYVCMHAAYALNLKVCCAFVQFLYTRCSSARQIFWVHVYAQFPKNLTSQVLEFSLYIEEFSTIAYSKIVDL